MPAPPKGRCHYPKKEGDRVVWCGAETRQLEDGSYMVFCPECMKKYEKAMKEIKKGERSKYRHQTMKVKGVTMYD